VPVQLTACPVCGGGLRAEGALGLRRWQRPEEPVAQERARKPIEEKESYRRLEGYQLACEVQQCCPETLVVNVADRGGDIRCGVDLGHTVEDVIDPQWIVRPGVAPVRTDPSPLTECLI
jgi:hypothetical protein